MNTNINLKRITTDEELLIWAKAVNFQNFPTCDMQDIYAHSEQKTIDRLFLEMKADRKLIICSVYNTMAYEEVERLLIVLSNAKAQQRMEVEYKEFDEVTALKHAELNKRADTLSRQEATFKEVMKPYHKRLNEMKHKAETLQAHNASLQRQLASMNAARVEARKEATEYHEKAEKYDAIRAALV